MSRFTGKSDRCHNYCGITCVNGSCPNAMADEYPEYGYEHCSCDDCGYYKGCEDCCWIGEDGNCDIDKKLEEYNNEDNR